MYAARPKSVLLAISTASSSVENLVTEMTGPNTSFWARLLPGSTSAKMVGSTKLPAASSPRIGLPPVTSRPEPSARAPSTRARIRSRAAVLMTGPNSTPGFDGSPIGSDSAAATSLATTSSYTLSWTRTREPRMQAWPLSADSPILMASADALSRSASAKMMLADLPPNSMTDGLRCSAQVARILRAVAGPPVKEIFCTLGCATRA